MLLSIKKRGKKYIPFIIITLVALFILLPQINTRFIPVGSDISFHYNRFYDLSEQIKSGNYNYFMSLYGFNSSGRIINALYGYDIAFLNGLILFFTQSWLKFQLVSSFICLIIAGIGMYFLMRVFDCDKRLSTIGAAIYMASAPIMYYVRALGFSSWGAAFLPYIFIQAIRSVKNKEKPINPVFLGLSMSLLVNTHILSAILSVLAIIPFYLVSFIHSDKKLSWIKQLCLSILIFILLSLNTLVAYIDVFLSNNILQPFIPSSFITNATYISITEMYGNRNIGIFFGTIFLFQLIYFIRNIKRTNTLEKIMTVVGGIFLLLSSSLFPWDNIVNHYPFLSVIQFPFRFSMISYVLLVPVFLKTIHSMEQHLSIKQAKVISLSLMILVGFILVEANSNMVKNAQRWQDDPVAMGNNRPNLIEKDPDVIRNNLRGPDLTKVFETIEKGTPDYLPISKETTSQEIYDAMDPYEVYEKEIFNNQKNITTTVLENGTIQLTWDNKKNSTKKKQLPLIVYDHSIVELNGKLLNKSDYETSDIGSLIITPKKGKNTVVLSYKPFVDMTYVLIIKAATTLIVILYCLKHGYTLLIKRKERTYD
ncbi:hypothetical protein [Vagococcus bubulae]|uniref:hypothetical protein n=1 Tax=Vagococcus bubulae TaxID=1977868 RepID=UPI000F7ED97D|nr:hypothetical protein [Vagococcus bubulae]